MKSSRVTFVFIVFLLTSLTISGQDLIVTSQLDSIKCKITSIDQDKIHYNFVLNGQTLITYLSFKEISHYKFDFLNPIYQKVRFALDFGLSQRIAKLNENVPYGLKEYTEELKSGTNYIVSICRFLNEKSGIGIKWSLHNSKSDGGHITTSSSITNSSSIAIVSDHIMINYIAPFYSARILSSSKKNAWFFNAGLGYLSYRNKGKLLSEFTLKGQTLGLNLDIGHDFILADNFALGFQVSYVMGTLTEFTDGTRTIELDKSDYESLNRLDLTVGFRFY